MRRVVERVERDTAAFERAIELGVHGRTTMDGVPAGGEAARIGSMKVPWMSPAKRGYDVATMTTVSAMSARRGSYFRVARRSITRHGM